jgi:rod shape-determining protein MreD
MNVVALFGLGLILIIFQTTAFRLLGMSLFRAPLVLAVILYASFRLEKTRGLCLSFLLGYALDVYSGGVQGITPMVMVLLCLAGQWMRRGIFADGNLALGMVSFTFGLMHGALWLVTGTLLEGARWLEDFSFLRLLAQATTLAVLSPFIVRLAEPIDRWSTAGWRRFQGLRT